VTTTVPLYETAIVTLNGSGSATAKLGPASAREVWTPSTAHVQANAGSVTNEAECSIFVGDAPTQQNFRDATFSGSSGDSSDRIDADTVKCGWYVWAVWTGGDAGATAYLNVTGSKTI
jgi:hypothetical protein